MAAVSTYAAVPSIVNVARLKNLYAFPNKRTSHLTPVPNLGGIAVYFGFMVSTCTLAGTYFHNELGYIISSLLIIFFAGLKDDILVIDPKKKLAAEFCAVIIIVVFANIRISNFYGLFGIMEIPYILSVIFTIFVFIVVINGFNLIDGIDGLASGTGFLVSSIFGIWFLTTGNIAYAIMSFAFAGSLISFFRFNISRNKYKIFLGDTGSLLIGFVTSILSTEFLRMNLNEVGNRYYIVSAPAVVCGILIIPLYDTLRIFLLRTKQHKSPFTADKQHMHHWLLRYGINHIKATTILLSFNILVIAVCFYFNSIGIIWLSLVILLLSAVFSSCLVYYYRYQIKKNLNIKYHTFTKISLMNRDKWKYLKNPLEILIVEQDLANHKKEIGKYNNLKQNPKEFAH